MDSSAAFHQFFIYNARYKVIICKSCKHGVADKGMQMHLRRQHSHVDIELRNQIITYTRGLVQTLSPDCPEPNSISILGLELMSGFECITCQYLCPKESSMEIHSRTNHNWVLSNGNGWEKCFIQSWFPTTGRKFFKVQPTQSESIQPVDHLIVNLLKEQKERESEEEQGLLIMSEIQGKTDRTPWLNRTRWLETFAGKDMKRLSEAVRKPGTGEKDLERLCQEVEIMIRHCIMGVQDCRQRNWLVVLCWLNGVELGKQDMQPFNTSHEASTIKRYIEIWQRFLCLCFRATLELDQV